MSWNACKRKARTVEISAIIMIISIIVEGIISDCLVSKGVVFVYVNNINGLSLTLLQIQAAITTLTITIIALLSGSISDSYMGIPLSMYYLEIRPCILKQKRVICIEFVGLICNVFMHIFSAYNVVIAVFLASMILILISVFEIYEIFKGRHQALEEIESYVYNQIEIKKDCYGLGKNLIYDWKNVAVLQTEDEFERYWKIYFKLIEVILSKYKDIDQVNDLSEEFASFLLTHESDKCRINGIKFIQDFYENIWLWINLNKEVATEIGKPVELLTRVDHEWLCAFNLLDAEQVENMGFRYEHFSESVIRVASWIGFSEERESFDVRTINGIGRTIGGYIDRQYKKGNLITTKYWQNIVTDKHGYYADGLPDNNKDFYCKSLASRDFNVVYGFLLNGQLRFIREGVFLEGIKNIYKIDTYAFAFKIMTIHCFMYYLAFRENSSCIEENLQGSIKEILLCDEVVSAISHFYYRMTESKNILNEKTENEMEDYLQHYELFPIHSNCKSMIIEGAVRDYFLYVVLLLERFSFYQGLANQLLNTQTYHMYLSDSNYELLKKRFSEMHTIFSKESLSEEDAAKKSEEMLYSFSSIMKKKYKEHTIAEAAKTQKAYDSENVRDKIIRDLKQDIEDKFNAFNSFSTECNGVIYTYEKVHVFRVLDFTRGIGEDYRDGYSEYVVSSVVTWIIHELSKRYNISVLDRNTRFESDQELREYLNDNNYEILMGSQYPFGATDYRSYDTHSEFLNSMECKFVSGGNDGVALKKDALYIKLNDVTVDISSPELDEYDFDVDAETGLYKYAPTQGITLDFEKEELRNFFKDERKSIDVYINITLGFDMDGNNGVIIKRPFKE